MSKIFSIKILSLFILLVLTLTWAMQYFKTKAKVVNEIFKFLLSNIKIYNFRVILSPSFITYYHKYVDLYSICLNDGRSVVLVSFVLKNNESIC